MNPTVTIFMLFRRKIWVLLICLTLNLCFSSATAAGTTIKRVDLDTFDRIIMNTSTVNMVVAMAAWCKPCREEMPTLERLHRQYNRAGLSLIGLSLDGSGPKKLQPLLDEHNVTFPVYWVGDDATKKYRIYGVPMTVIIKNGEIVDKIPGQRSEDFFRKRIEELLKTD
jgi:thiol-disulfide isomerase/thioredoxin